MKLPSQTRFADPKIKNAFYKLAEGDSTEQQLFKFINQAMDNIEQNAFCGIQVHKRQIPQEYIKKYSIKNLWKYDLPNAWRLMYSIVGGRAVVVSIVLEWLTHKEYGRLFGYT